MMEFGLKTKFEFQKELIPEVQSLPKLQCVIGSRITSVAFCVKYLSDYWFFDGPSIINPTTVKVEDKLLISTV